MPALPNHYQCLAHGEAEKKKTGVLLSITPASIWQ
jgi:hypothetical protein